MSTAVPPPPSYTDVQPQQRARGGLIALILGIVALVFAFIPFVSYVAGFIAIAAIIVGAVALRNVLNSRGQALTGLILGIVALILAVIMSIVYSLLFIVAGAASSALNSYSAGTLPTDVPSATSLASAPASASGGKLVYKVTGAGSATSITYLSVDASGAGQDQLKKTKLPWSKSIGVNDDSSYTGFTLVAQRGADDGSITCTITLNGKVISKKTSSGQYAVVSCSGSDQ